eukprot:6567262-Lingulodinium_polyedra.AAC.1
MQPPRAGASPRHASRCRAISTRVVSWSWATGKVANPAALSSPPVVVALVYRAGHPLCIAPSASTRLP